MKIATSAQMQSIDRRTIGEIGIPGAVLMERAGLAVAQRILERSPQPEAVEIVAGTGNNGGDGFVVAREIFCHGLRVRVHVVGDTSRIAGDARTNLMILERLGIPVRSIASPTGLRLQLAEGRIVVDALFGTGLDRETTGIHMQIIRKINQSGLPVVAVDIPSGLSADTGRPLGEAIRAVETVTFGLPKRGHLLYPGPLYTGRLTVADIGFPAAAVDAENILLSTLEASDIFPLLPTRPPDGHKGTFGHLLIVAGSRGKAGAASLAGLAGLRMGCGLVTLAVPEGIASSIHRDFPEGMILTCPESRDGSFSSLATETILGALEGKDALAMGPGLSVNAEIMAMVRTILMRSKKPVVLDADGINALMHDAVFLKNVRCPMLLTPHPAEFGRLIDRETVAVQSDRVGMATSFAGEYGKNLVLKGAHTIVADPDGRVFMNTTGNAGMATAGSGDVLTGLIGGLIAGGASPSAAARAGVYLHGLAGDLAAAEKTERAIVAGDIIDAIPETLKRIESPRTRDRSPK